MVKTDDNPLSLAIREEWVLHKGSYCYVLYCPETKEDLYTISKTDPHVKSLLNNPNE